MRPGDGGWQVVRVDIAEHLADAASSLLADEGAPTVLTGVRDQGSTTHPAPGRATLEAHVPAERAPGLADTLAGWLASLATVDPAAAAARVTTSPLPPLDWDAAFRRHHRPVAVGRRLLVAPPWAAGGLPGRELLVVDPGLAFGTGQHETTRTCLEEIEDAVEAGGVATALDVGTGSGVLAVALARLGVARVVALDVDRAALPAARATIARNRAAGVALVGASAAAIRGRFDLVVANLLAGTLIEEREALGAVVAPRGRLVVSGILEDQAARVVAAFAPSFRVTATRAAGAWRTLRLER